MQKKLFLFLLCMGLAVAVRAQVNLSAQVDKTNLALDDELTLTVHVKGVTGTVVMPQLPSLPAFNVYSREMEQSSINGETSLQFRYVMLPRFVGNTTIGAVQFNYKGQTYKTEPISVHIYRSAANVPSAKSGRSYSTVEKADPNLPPLEAALANQAYAKSGTPFFLVAAVSNSSPYVNQPFTLGVRFYYSQAFHDAPYQKPTVSNLFMEELDSREGSQKIGGTLYRYQEQRYLLSAVAAGKTTIGPATVHYRTGSPAKTAFDRIFGGLSASQERTASSVPITLQARALPADDRPNTFYGAVGSPYTIKATADPLQVPASEAVNVTVTVKGAGNLKATQDIRFPAIEGFKIYPAAATSETGYKTFKAVYVPSSSGIYTIPSIAWSYFNPETASYHTIQTAPIQLTVTPAEKEDGGFNFATALAMGNGVQTLSRDIAYLKMTPAATANIWVKLGQQDRINKLCFLLVALAALFATLGQKSLTRKRAFLTAKSQLKKDTSLQAVNEAVHTYLQHRLHLSTGSLPLKEITSSLRQKGATPATAEVFALLWQQLEAQRFAPQQDPAAGNHPLAAQALDVLKRIEEETK